MTGPGTTTYFAALFRLDDTNNRVKRASVHLIDADNGDTITFGEDIAGVRAIRVSASTVATGGNSVAAAEDTAFENGQTFWMIGRYFNSDVVDGDILQLLAYDIEDSESIASEFDLTDPAADVVLSLSGVTIDLAKISMLRFEVRGASDNFIDELRIGQSFDEVTRGLFAAVPEPASGIHVLCGIVTAGFLSAYHGLRRRESVSLQRQHER
jgi:hypothetical protein